ncbi:hypothetical protein SprV_0200780300 [Sparganum proliferum]
MIAVVVENFLRVCRLSKDTSLEGSVFLPRYLDVEEREHSVSFFLHVDLMEAFVTVDHSELRKITQKFGCPERFMQMVSQLHDGMMACITDSEAVSEAFTVTNGVEQGCLLAPHFLILMLSALLMDACRSERHEISIIDQTDVRFSMPDARRRQRGRPQLLHSADDHALIIATGPEIHRNMNLFASSRIHFTLVIDTDKTVVMHQSRDSRIITNATANQPEDLGGPHPGRTGLESSSEDWSSDSRKKPDRSCQSQKNDSQVSSASDSKRQHSSHFNMLTLLANVPRTVGPRRTSTDSISNDTTNPPAVASSAPYCHPCTKLFSVYDNHPDRHQ